MTFHFRKTLVTGFVALGSALLGGSVPACGASEDGVTCCAPPGSGGTQAAGGTTTGGSAGAVSSGAGGATCQPADAPACQQPGTRKLVPGQCRAKDDCTSNDRWASCELKETLACRGGGMAPPPHTPEKNTSLCKADTDCKAKGSLYVCIEKPDGCRGDSHTECVEGCASDTQCSAQQRCEQKVSEQHPLGMMVCVNTGCEDTGAKACPAPLECGPPNVNLPNALRQCVPAKCGSDAQCSQGWYCVNGRCNDAPGVCYSAPA